MRLREDRGVYINTVCRYAIYVLLCLCLIFIIQFCFSFVSDEQEAIEQGNRIEIDVVTSKVTMRDSEENNTDASEEGETLEEVIDDVEEEESFLNEDAPKLAIVIKGMGLNRTLTQTVINMPGEVGLSFSPYVGRIAGWVERAQDTRHEIYLDLPMETDEYPSTDSGPYTLLTHAGKAKNMFRLKSTMSLTDQYVGLIGSNNEKITRSLQTILPVVDELRKQRTVLIYKETPHNTFLDQEARAVGLSIINKFFVIDEILTTEEIDKKLNEAIRILQEDNESVLVVGHAYPITLNRILTWMKKLNAQNIPLSNVSDLIIRN